MSNASSPCTGVCTVDAASALCLGCGRTIDEILAWSALSELQRLTVMADLPGRQRENGDVAPSIEAALQRSTTAHREGSDRWTGAS